MRPLSLLLLGVLAGCQAIADLSLPTYAGSPSGASGQSGVAGSVQGGHAGSAHGGGPSGVGGSAPVTGGRAGGGDPGAGTGGAGDSGGSGQGGQATAGAGAAGQTTSDPADACPGKAYAISPGETLSIDGDLTNLHNDFSTDCGGENGHDAIYVVTVGGSGVLTLNLLNGFGGTVAVVQACGLRSGPCGASFPLQVTQGQTLFLVVDAPTEATSGGPYSLKLYLPPAMGSGGSAGDMGGAGSSAGATGGSAGVAGSQGGQGGAGEPDAAGSSGAAGDSAQSGQSGDAGDSGSGGTGQAGEGAGGV